MILEIGANLNELQEFIQVFGQRYIGLVDNGNIQYQAYRVPNPEAPYPQDYIIDQNGIVRYWSDEYDPRAIIKTIDRLLNTCVAEAEPVTNERLSVKILPNPSTAGVVITVSGFRTDARIKIYDMTGRVVKNLNPVYESPIVWKGNLPAGVYFVRIDADGQYLTKNFILTR